jgi:hypothetical protein
MAFATLRCADVGLTNSEQNRASRGTAMDRLGKKMSFQRSAVVRSFTFAFTGRRAYPTLPDTAL